MNSHSSFQGVLKAWPRIFEGLRFFSNVLALDFRDFWFLFEGLCLGFSKIPCQFQGHEEQETHVVVSFCLDRLPQSLRVGSG